MDYDPRMPPVARHWMLLTIAVGGVLQMLISAARPDSPGVKNALSLFGSPQPSLLRRWNEIDTRLDESLANTRDHIAADFDSQTAQNDPSGETRSLFYVRATYHLWPRRFYICDPGDTVLFADSLTAARLPTDPAWMTAHHIGARLHAELVPPNRVTLHVESTPQP